ncbi:hypothetical protein AVEN_222535-1 [Araneus ventricosus]|uniref:Uncharacterized protein n=1 Tax=Araneus ventricosus TaxID=182803 RepID=A0A4Y2GVY5_ARAVE|nr:hypothetical protein AVEN_222535-1 [Araneus ventricosus]
MILTILKSGSKAVGKQAPRSGIDVTNDLMQGKEIKASAKQRAKEAAKILTEKAADKAKTMVGGNKRKRHSKKQVISKKYRKTAIKKGQWLEYHPIANIRDGNPIEFSVSGSGEDYIDLSATQLYVKVKILKVNAKLGETDKVSSVNLLLHSLFSQVDVNLNDRLISASSNLYPFRSYIESLLNYGSDYKKSFLSSECFNKDSAGYLGVTDPAGDNEGLKKRASLIEKSKVLDLIENLHCDIFYQDRLLLNLVDLKVKLIRSKQEFCLIAPANGNYEVIIEHASLFVCKVKVSPDVLLLHKKALQLTSVRYPIDRILSKMYSISKGSFSFSQDNVFLGQML